MTAVTMRHIRAAKMCSRGARDFAREHGIDWEAFLAGKVDSETLKATGDAMAIAAAEIAEADGQS